MPDFPDFGVQRAGGNVISVASALSGVSVTAPSNAAWTAANRAIYVPVRVPYRVTIAKIIIGAGATASGNFDVGIYTKDGTRVVSSGSTAKGSLTEHVVDITDTNIGPGLYYLAMAADGTDAYTQYAFLGSSPLPLQKARIVGALMEESAFPLPATATMVALTAVTLPSIVAVQRSL